MPSDGPTSELLCQVENLAEHYYGSMEKNRCEQAECEEEKEDYGTQMSWPLPPLHAFCKVCPDNTAASTSVPIDAPSLQEEPFFGNFFAPEQPSIAQPFGVPLEPAQTSATLTQHPRPVFNSGPSHHNGSPQAIKVKTPGASNLLQSFQARTRPRPDAHSRGLPCIPRKQRRSRFRAPTLECIEEKMDNESEADNIERGGEALPATSADEVKEEKGHSVDHGEPNARASSARRHIRAPAVSAASFNPECLDLSQKQLRNVLSLQLATDRRVFCLCLATAVDDGKSQKSCSLCWSPELELKRELLAKVLGRHWLKYQSWQQCGGIARATDSRSVEPAMKYSGTTALHSLGRPSSDRRTCNAWTSDVRTHEVKARACADTTEVASTQQSISMSTPAQTTDALNMPDRSSDQNMDGSRHGLRRRPGSPSAISKCLVFV